MSKIFINLGIKKKERLKIFQFYHFQKTKSCNILRKTDTNQYPPKTTLTPQNLNALKRKIQFLPIFYFIVALKTNLKKKYFYFSFC